MLDVQQVRQDFPSLSQSVHGKPLVYLDSAATAQKPRQVIRALSEYYEAGVANVHRGVHSLSDAATEAWEQSRATVAHFFGASQDSLIFTRNTTEALNGVAYGWGVHALKPGDSVVTTLMEHHSNFVVWQELCKRTHAHLHVIGVDAQGRLDVSELERVLQANTGRVRLIALTHVSNTTGVVNPVSAVVHLVRKYSGDAPTRVVLDAAQSAPHLSLEFERLGVDFLAFSGHKLLGPMGIGGLLVRSELLDSGEFHPWLFGGGMIAAVTKQGTQFHADASERFTAGTPDVASAIGLAAACEYLTALGMEQVAAHDRELVRYALEQLLAVPEVELIGPTPAGQADSFAEPLRVGSVAFLYRGVHAHDVAQVLDSEGIAVRSGHHCTMPLHTHFGWQATTRASFHVYTAPAEIDALVRGLHKVKQVFGIE